jgi:hypothetical protein
MDVLTVHGQNYIKASTIAKNLGYTADYVGQLCRAGKVDAKLVGRSWYVLEDSIQSHKQDRYRTSQAKTIKQVEQHIATNRQEKVSIPTTSHFYSRTISPKTVTYTTDAADLIPHVDKEKATSRHIMDIGLADATSVKIESEKEALVFETPELPKLKFKGTLVVSDFNEDDIALPDGGRLIHPEEKGSFKIFKKPINKAISAKRAEVVKPKEPKGTKHLHPTDSDLYHHVTVDYIHEHLQIEKSSLIVTFLTYFLLVLSIPLSIAFLTLESQVIATSSSSQISFFLTLEYLQKVVATFL